eukprot:CAMPEP_0201490026 /NCGR_PEP_ID=MMETSP0151_2-20130828/24723_1 /ASSEMBLY_ACC=CAM_ASM_000257 /TAXON_ID=200890 /ORGANISM="Paramoeba atlantica, Strain 621/1 / CCAP 1560/9" /LENGTH=396 /DNA_ID=CAMNT_0047875813 /DNA_START=60 /DNA_END=1250 /DNA_ORIENTATION=+
MAGQSEEWLVAVAMSEGNESIKKSLNLFLDLSNRKLWHQLTTALLDFITKEDYGEKLIPFYENFIRSFESKINQLKLAQIIVHVSKRFAEPKEAIVFLEGALERHKTREAAENVMTITPDIPQARVYCECETSSLRLRCGSQEGVKEVIESSAHFLESSLGVDSIVFSSHYRLQLEYFKELCIAEGYYKNSLLYLAYTPLDTVPVQTQIDLGFDLCLSALVSETIYTFGDLLTHKILDVVSQDKSKQWIVFLLRAFSSGNIERYEALVEEHKVTLNQQPLLVQNVQLLSQKISILSLIELIFQQSLSDRTIPFPVIAKATKLPVEEVELLLMKSLSLGLIKGTIDQVSQSVFISWVQPRILEIEQVSLLRDRLADWSKSVDETLLFLESDTTELVV